MSDQDVRKLVGALLESPASFEDARIDYAE
jgi:hypothetical protein